MAIAKEVAFHTIQKLEKDYGPAFCSIFSGNREITKVTQAEHNEILRVMKTNKCYDSTQKKLKTIEDLSGDPLQKSDKEGYAKIDTSTWGKVSVIKSVEEVLFVLSQYTWLKDGPWGKKGEPMFANFYLPVYNPKAGVQGLGQTGLIDWANLWINYKAQRTINVYNIVKYLLRFKSELVFGAKGRCQKSKNRYFVNDGQHCTILLSLCGAVNVPMAYIESEDESVDIDQFLSFNVDNYDTEIHDKIKNQSFRGQMMIDEEGKEPYKEDQIPLGITDVLAEFDCEFIPKARKQEKGQTKTVEKFIDLFEEFGPKPNGTYHRYFYNEENPDALSFALKIDRRAWKARELKQEPIWGLCELISAQGSMTESKLDNMLGTVALAMKKHWTTGPSSVWAEVNAVINDQFPNTGSTKEDLRNKSGLRGKMIGVAIYDIVNAYVKFQKQHPGNYKVKDPGLKPITDSEGNELKFDTSYPNTFDDKFIKLQGVA